MTTRPSARISSRKQPRQARSAGLVAAILEAAIQVLAKEGAQRFTTARVAEAAGVSVGSLYQYFPNKAAILFRLQSDEWRQTSEMLSAILEDAGTAPPERLRALVLAFVRSECEEAEMRVALNDAAPLYRDAPEARRAQRSGSRTVQAFLREALPGAADGRRGRSPPPGRRADHRDSEPGGQAVLRDPPDPGRDRGLFRRHGRHVLRLSADPRSGLGGVGEGPAA